jgi:hypothetical protein
VAYDQRTGDLVGNFSLDEQGEFAIAGLQARPYVVRVEPLDDGDIESFFDARPTSTSTSGRRSTSGWWWCPAAAARGGRDHGGAPMIGCRRARRRAGARARVRGRHRARSAAHPSRSRAVPGAVGRGVAFLSGTDFGAASATLTSNQVPPTRYTCSRPIARCSAPGFEARLGYMLTRSFGVEGALLYSRPRLETRLSGDVEGATPLTAVNELSQYMLDVSGVLHLQRLRFGRACRSCSEAPATCGSSTKIVRSSRPARRSTRGAGSPTCSGSARGVSCGGSPFAPTAGCTCARADTS